MIDRNNPHDKSEGRRRRDAALDAHKERRAAVIRASQRALLSVLLERPTATPDDVRHHVTLAPGIDPVCLGAVPTALAKAGIIERVGYVPTTRPEGHARPVSVWRLVDRERALIWLAEHPPIPLPGASPSRQRGLFDARPRPNCDNPVSQTGRSAE